MNHRLRSAVLVVAAFGIAGAACTDPKQDSTLRPQPAPVQAFALRADRDTGGSAKGDFGPPRGEPIKAIITDAPHVPPPTGRDYPAKVIVELEVKEVEKEISPGVRYTFWTFGGSVPGKFIRVRQGDTVQFTLMNAPDSKMPHNIDLHAVTGPGGGAASTFTAPGHQTQFTFKALNQGLYVYHCATAPVGLHIANGMYGLIYVEPPEGLPPVDREYYVMQGDFYTVGRTGEKGLQPFDQEKAVAEQPTYVLFNGKEGALTGEGALKANVGETVRLFLGNGGPNLVSSFHVIGEIFDYVHTEGGSRVQENVQTTLIPAGGSTIAEFKIEVPGAYALVDHSIFRAFNKGALGLLKVSGPEQKDIYSGKEKESVYAGRAPSEVDPSPVQLGAQPAEATPTAAPAAAPAKKLSLAEQLEAGKGVYTTTCMACHQVDGKGIPAAFPPLAKSDFLMADKQRSIGVVVRGLSGAITVNGQTFNSQMPPLSYLSDGDIANVLTYVRNSFGNKGDAVTVEEVSAVRNGGGSALAAEH